MTAVDPLRALAERATRRPRVVLALALLVGLGCGALALGLHPSAATDTFVSRSSGTYRETQRFYRNFGEEPIEVLVKGELQKLVLSSDITRLVGLEGCLSGNVPPRALRQEGGIDGPCGQLVRLKTVKVVLGPGTFINEAAEEISNELSSQQAQAEAAAKQSEKVITRAALARGMSVTEAHKIGHEAGKVMLQRFAESVATLALRYGLTSQPSLNNPNFIERVVFDSTKKAGTPKQKFAYLFPSRESALISVRLKAGLSEAQRNRTIAVIRSAVAMRQWHLAHGETYMVTGEPVIVSDLASSISRSLKLLLIAALVVMGIVLGLVFGARPRLLPLALALLAAALTFGVLAAFGASLTLGEVAVLPVLIGLAVDYAIQFQSRVAESLDKTDNSPRDAVLAAVRDGAPAITTAALASAAAMLVLGLSPVPTVQGFGLLLVLGILLALLVALTVGSAVLTLSLAARAGSSSATVGAGAIERLGTPVTALAGAWRGARALLAENPLNRFVSRTALEQAARRPQRVLLVGVALAALGWGLGTQTQVQTDISKLVPQDTGSLQALQELERMSGVGGEIDLMITGKDLTKPSVISWMSSYQQGILNHFHYSEAKGCGKAQLCPAFSLPDLFSPEEGAATKLSEKRVQGVLAAIPPYFSEDVISANHRAATLAFGIRLMGLSEQQHVIESMRSELHPPKGVSAQLVGLAVLAAQSGAAVSSVPRRMLSLALALLAILLVLFVAFGGDHSRVLVTALPVILASGWSSLVLFAIRVPLNPLSVTLDALVIAISTEFSVLLCVRHRQERAAGHSPSEALRRSYERTGAAIAASALTAIAGFGVLVLSDISMLRDFGLVTLVDLSVALLGVLIVLPSALMFFERGEFERPLTASRG